MEEILSHGENNYLIRHSNFYAVYSYLELLINVIIYTHLFCYLFFSYFLYLRLSDFWVPYLFHKMFFSFLSALENVFCQFRN